MAALIRELAATPLLNSQAAYRSPSTAPLLIKHPAHYKYTHQIKSNQRCGNLQRVSSLRTRSNARISGRIVQQQEIARMPEGNAPTCHSVCGVLLQYNTNVHTQEG